MARSNYLRSLAGPLPENTPLLRPPRVSPWAQPRVTEAFAETSLLPRSASEPADSASGLPAEATPPAVSLRGPFDLRPAAVEHPAKHFEERESVPARNPDPAFQASFEPVRPMPAADHAKPLHALNPIQPNRLEHTGENASATRPSLDVAIAARPQAQTAAAVPVLVGDSSNSARTNRATAPPARQAGDVSSPLNPPGRPEAPARTDREITRKIPEGLKEKPRANEGELFERVVKPRRPATPGIPLQAVADEIQTPTTKIDDARPGNSVHIGTVEIHLTPPPAPVSRQAPSRAAAGTGVLSRGFMSAFGFTQG